MKTLDIMPMIEKLKGLTHTIRSPENCSKRHLKSPNIAALISLHAMLFSLFLFFSKSPKMKEEGRGLWRWSAPSGWTAEETVVALFPPPFHALVIVPQEKE